MATASQDEALSEGLGRMGCNIGSAACARFGDVAAEARERLDAAAAMASVEDAQRSALAALVALWPTSAWLAAGATSAKRWLLTSTCCSTT